MLDQRHKYAEVKHSKYAEKICEHTKGGVYIAKVMYIAKGKYIEYAKDGINAAKSKHSEYAVQHVCS